MKRYYSFAGVNICIQGSDEYMYKDEHMLEVFRVEYLDNPDIFYFTVVEELKKPNGKLYGYNMECMEYVSDEGIYQYVGTMQQEWNNAYMLIEHIGKEHFVSVKNSVLRGVLSVNIVYKALMTERLMKNMNTIIMHASFIEHNGTAILFTAPSGIGKSTQADLWKQHRGAQVINGDRVAIRYKDNQLYACGVPFAGSSNICENKSFPLVAIVSLEQAEKTTAKVLKGVEAFKSIYANCGVITWDRAHVEFVSDFIENLLKRVSVFHLKCTPDESAIVALEDGLREQ